MRKLTHDELLARQALRNSGGRLPVCVILNNIRSLYNVGAVFRTSDGAGVEKMWLCGITGYPPQAGIAKTALGSETRVPWEYRKDAVSLIQELKEEGYQIVLLEQTAQSIPYEEFEPRAPLALVLGNEITGVSEGILSFCDKAVEIEMAGVKNSLNVAVAFGIVAYHFRNRLRSKVGP